MKYLFHMHNYSWLMAVLLGAAPVLAQDAKQEKPANQEEILGYPDNSVEGYAPVVEYTEADIKKECRKYEGNYVSYYGGVYFVKGCTLHEIEAINDIQNINRRGVKIITIENSTVAKLGIGDPMTASAVRNKSERGCKELNNKYVTNSYTDVFFVEICKKRQFPDWTTFIEHRKSRGRRAEQVLVLTPTEFASLPTGQDMPSYVDKEFKSYRLDEGPIDVIPLNEACRGLNGKDVTYVDRIYKIENCHKREYEPTRYLRRMKNKKLNFIELTDEQWLSLPDGPPMDKVLEE